MGGNSNGILGQGLEARLAYGQGQQQQPGAQPGAQPAAQPKSAFDDPGKRKDLTLWDFLQPGAPSLTEQMQNPFGALEQAFNGPVFGAARDQYQQQDAAGQERLTRATQKKQDQDARRVAMQRRLLGGK